MAATLGPGQLVWGWGGRGIADVVGYEADRESGRGLCGYEDHGGGVYVCFGLGILEIEGLMSYVVMN